MSNSPTVNGIPSFDEAHALFEAAEMGASVSRSEYKERASVLREELLEAQAFDLRGLEAVEVDVDEALSHYYRTWVTIFSILGFTLVLSVGAILFVLIVGERTSRALMRARDNLEKKVTERTAELRKLSQATENSPASVVITDKKGNSGYNGLLYAH